MVAPRTKLLVVAEVAGELAAVKRALRGLWVESVAITSCEALAAHLVDAAHTPIIIAVLSPVTMTWFETCRGAVRASRAAWLAVCIKEYDTFAETEETAYRLGAVDVLTAPLVPARLRNKLRNWLELFALPKAVTEVAPTQTAILQSLGAGVVVCDAEGSIVYANAAAAGLLGCAPQALEGTEFGQWLVDRRSRRHRVWLGHRIARRVRDAGRFHSDTLRLRCVDGSVLPVDLTATPHAGQDGSLVIVLTDISARQRREAQLVHAAQYDALTGLSNRQHFFAQVEAGMVRADRRKTQAAVLVMDVDGFDAINHRYGREMGDQLLITVAERLRRRFRASDSLGRIGADEFAVLVEEVRTPEDLLRMGQELLELLSEPYGLQGMRIELGACLGVAQMSDALRDTASLMLGAEAALHKARTSAVRSLAVFDASWEAARTRSAIMRTALSRAVDRNELELFYQPRVELGNGAISAWEALLRWHHPDLGCLSPDIFLEMANDTGAIEDIGTWVVQAATRQIRDWKAAGLWGTDMALGINASDVQLTQFNIVQALDDAAREHDIDPRSIEVDVAEESILRHGGAHRAATQLSDRGFGVVLDNFGANMTSINLLRNVPFRAVKLDRSLVRDLAGRSRGHHAISAVLGLSTNMQLGVVAEGVETREQADWLRQAGCSMAQGYFYSRPVPALVATELLSGRYIVPRLNA